MLQAHQIPSTGRKASYQARQLGFDSVSAFANSLPPKAVVADIGAGLSRLGHEVAALRTDISWINLDPCYDRPANRKAAQQAKPANLKLLPLDVVTESPELAKLYGTVDLVYSYWLLPHLSLEDDSAAIAAARHMLKLLAPGGRVVIGPIRRLGPGLLSPYRYNGTATYHHHEDLTKAAQNIVAKTRLWWLARFVQLLSNRHDIHIGKLFVGGKKGH